MLVDEHGILDLRVYSDYPVGVKRNQDILLKRNNLVLPCNPIEEHCERSVLRYIVGPWLCFVSPGGILSLYIEFSFLYLNWRAELLPLFRKKDTEWMVAINSRYTWLSHVRHNSETKKESEIHVYHCIYGPWNWAVVSPSVIWAL